MIERTIFDTYKAREDKLKGLSYSEYLHSKHWISLRKKLHKIQRYSKCNFCSSREVHLHHKTYRNIYTSREKNDIIPLCSEHHKEVHELASKRKTSVFRATNVLLKRYTKKKEPLTDEAVLERIMYGDTIKKEKASDKQISKWERTEKDIRKKRGW